MRNLLDCSRRGWVTRGWVTRRSYLSKLAVALLIRAGSRIPDLLDYSRRGQVTRRSYLGKLTVALLIGGGQHLGIAFGETSAVVAIALVNKKWLPLSN